MNRSQAKLLAMLLICVISMVVGLFGLRETNLVATENAMSPLAVPASQTRHGFVPLAVRQSQVRKLWSGIHLGNRSSDWNMPRDFLARLKGSTNGDYPAAVVVMSEQLYSIVRSQSSPCNIVSASIRTPYLYSYLTNAIRFGTRVVIRIYPSPGNFIDAADPTEPHDLLTGNILAGTNYCNDGFRKFRAVNDVASEIRAIYNFNVQQGGWPAQSFYFEPANEPNSEWYPPGRDPDASRAISWQLMDRYFSNLYDSAKQLAPQARVLTPPMAQGYYAEGRVSLGCTKQLVQGGVAGYDLMHNTFEAKNDGFSWHNYWRKGKETWSTSVPACPTDNTPVTSDHIYQYFPQWLQDTIAFSPQKLAIISEADILSPCQAPGMNPITNKDTQSTETQESVWRFIYEDLGTDITAVWLLTNQYADWDGPSMNCNDNNQEIAWHEAIRDTSGERTWFRLWWLRNEGQ